LKLKIKKGRVHGMKNLITVAIVLAGSVAFSVNSFGAGIGAMEAKVKSPSDMVKDKLGTVDSAEAAAKVTKMTKGELKAFQDSLPPEAATLAGNVWSAKGNAVAAQAYFTNSATSSLKVTKGAVAANLDGGKVTSDPGPLAAALAQGTKIPVARALEDVNSRILALDKAGTTCHSPAEGIDPVAKEHLLLEVECAKANGVLAATTEAEGVRIEGSCLRQIINADTTNANAGDTASQLTEEDAEARVRDLQNPTECGYLAPTPISAI
jgi:hypothetical protein